MSGGIITSSLPQGNGGAEKTAIVAITKHGARMGRRLQDALPQQTELYYPDKFAEGDEAGRGIHLFSGNIRLILPGLWQQYRRIVMLFSLGAVIRLIAPLLQDKKQDPAVVVLDEAGEYAISVLSGHLGGANLLAKEIAVAIGAKPVITTASDVQKTIAVDLFGRSYGWRFEAESTEKLLPVSAAVVNEEHVALVQESGEPDWWPYDTPPPAHIKQYATIEQALTAKPKPQAALVVTHRLLSQAESAILENGVLYRPKVIALGIGCNRGTSAEEIEAVITAALADLRFSINSVKAVCTIDLKKDEAGLLAVCQKYGWEFLTYTPEQLNEMKIEEPSQTVFRVTGAYGVSEPAAKRYAGTDTLALTKRKSGNVTISVGIVSFS